MKVVSLLFLSAVVAFAEVDATFVAEEDGGSHVDRSNFPDTAFKTMGKVDMVHVDEDEAEGRREVYEVEDEDENEEQEDSEDGDEAESEGNLLLILEPLRCQDVTRFLPFSMTHSICISFLRQR
jgi:hypothetical protein